MTGRGKSKNEAGYGQGVVSLELSDDVLLDEDELTARLLEVFNSPSYDPPTLPSVAVELVQLSQRPDVKIDDVVSLLEQDTMLTGRVMKILQSPIYRSSHELSLKQSVVRIGLTTLRDIVLQTAMNMRVFKADVYTDTLERLRRHSTLTAHLSKLICRFTRVEGEYAFLCGLLHDVGTAGAILALGEAKARQRPDLISIWPTIDRVHQEAGRHMIELWGLPQEVQWVTGSHHQVLIDGYAHSLVATVCLADHMAHELGVGPVAAEGEAIEGASAMESSCLASYATIDRSGEKTLEHAKTALDLDDAQLERVLAEARELAEKL